MSGVAGRTVKADLGAALHLGALWALSVAQPLFDLLGQNAEFFVVRGSSRWDVVAFAAGITLVPPAALALAEALAGRIHPGLGRGIHLAAVAGLVALIAIQAATKAGDPSGAVLLPGAALVGVSSALAYDRLAPVRTFVSVLAPAPLVFLGLFLFASPTGKLVQASDPAPRAVEIASATPVVLIVFDEISTTSLLDERGRIDAVRYPNFAELARDSTWFRNAATVDAWTSNAVPAILTGTLPEHGRLPVFSEHPDNLFTLLGGTYRLYAAESLTQLCPRPLCPDSSRPSFPHRMESLLSDAGLVFLHLALPRDLRRQLPSVSDTWGAFLESSHARTRRRLSAHHDFVASLRDGERPTLVFAHLMFPHVPWEFLPSGRRYDGGDLPGFETNRWGSDSFLVEQGYQRYLLQLGFADRLLGDLVRRLRSTGMYERSLLIVVADHGVSFHPEGRRRAFTEANLDDVVFVPLFVKRPGQESGVIVDDLVQTIDILPTIADVAGVRVPWRVDGESLFGLRRRERFILVGDRETFTADLASLAARRAASLERQISLFGSGAEPPGLYGIGPHPDLLGRHVAELVVLPAREASARLDQAAELRSVDLGAEELPARLTGVVSGEGGPIRSLAVALGGRIVATARSYSFAGEERFSVLIPESALRQGTNRVELFWVQADRSLVPLFGR
jgi:hypothetical protein